MTKPSVALPLAGLACLLGACASDSAVEYQTNIDTFAQSPNNEVDILWVVDDSNSMEQEQAALIAGFQSFAAQLVQSGTVFQLGLITTSYDYADDELGYLIGDPPFLTNDDDYETEFAARATVGTGGSDKEKGLEATLGTVQPTMTMGGPNDGFIRPSAELLVIWVSDEDDCSDAGALEGQDGNTCYSERERLTPVVELVQDLYDVKGDPALVSVGAIVGTPSSTCDEVQEGKRYIEAVQHMGGIVGDICKSDWSGILSDLGLTATGIHRMFQLTQAAQIDTIEVTVDETVVPQDPASGWTYDELTWWLEFHGTSIPDRGASISVTYTVDPGKLAPETPTN